MEDTNVKFKATIEWMSDRYNKANRELFNGELGDCAFTIRAIGGRKLGRFYMDVRFGKLYTNRYSRRMYIRNGFSDNCEYINKENFAELCHPTIQMNSNYSGTELSLYTTLVHEMCHYYTYMNGYCPKQGHGPEFRQIGSIVSYRSNGAFTVQRLASAEEMSGYEVDDKIKQQIKRREENKIAKLNYILVKTKTGELRLFNITDMGVIERIINIHDKRGEKVYELKNHDIAKQLYDLGFKRHMRTYTYWELNPESIIVKEIFSNPRNYKDLTDDYLMENIMNRNLKHDVIEITPNMDLGQYSPLEIGEINEEKRVMKINERQLRQIIRESIEEISNQLAGSAIKQAKEKNRYYQQKNMTKMTVDNVNSKYAFEVPVEDNGICRFEINYTQNWGFFIWTNYNGHGFALKPYLNHFKFITNNYYVSETPIGFVIDNLKAGERLKLNGLVNAVNELNGESEEELNETAIKGKYSDASMKLIPAIFKHDPKLMAEIFNTFDPETKNAVYNYYADTNRIEPQLIQAMRENL